MSTNSNEIREQFVSIFDNISSQEKTEHDAQILMFKFLGEIEKLAEERGIKTRKELAKTAGITPSYLTRLLRGDKKLNFETIAKFQQALGVVFDIHAAFDTHAAVPRALSGKAAAKSRQVPFKRIYSKLKQQSI